MISAIKMEIPQSCQLEECNDLGGPYYCASFSKLKDDMMGSAVHPPRFCGRSVIGDVEVGAGAVVSTQTLAVSMEKVS